MLVSSVSDTPIRDEDSFSVILTTKSFGYYSVSDCVDLHNNEREIPISLPFKVFRIDYGNDWYFNNNFKDDNYVSTIFFLLSLQYSMENIVYIDKNKKDKLMLKVKNILQRYTRDIIQDKNITEIIEKSVLELSTETVLEIGEEIITNILKDLVSGDLEDFGFTAIDKEMYNYLTQDNKKSINETKTLLDNYLKHIEQLNIDKDQLKVSSFISENYSRPYSKLKQEPNKQFGTLSFSYILGGVEKVVLPEKWLLIAIVYNELLKKSSHINSFLNESYNLTRNMFLKDICYKNPKFNFGGYNNQLERILVELKSFSDYKDIDISRLEKEISTIKEKIPND